MRIPQAFIRWLGALSLAAATAVIVTACGGGGSGNGSTPSSTGSGSASAANGSAVSNQAVISVGQGVVAGLVNMPAVSVTICAPGTSNCQTISNVLVDTGSYGLRIVGSAASSVLGSLPVVTAGSGGSLAECGTFVSSYTWGTVRTADVKISGEQASALPIQIIGDVGTSNVPTSCTNGGSSANTVEALGGNGILGIGPAPYDCGATCVTSTTYSNYYACPNGNSSCQITAVPLAQQVANPVQQFATDNNGVILSMPQVSSSGQASAAGTLTFGIGTESNNTRTASTVLPTTTAGDLTGTFLGSNVSAFFDSGSNGYFFNDSSLATCSGDTSFYCPSSTETFTAQLTGYNSSSTAGISMTVANASALFANSSAYAFNDLAGPFGTAGWLDVGLPYFYGKTVYVGMDLTANGGAAPYVAF